jgi:nanoRNase/pAp phosphatase (c-di-AMP/oligoRNAs hydrolase)
LPRLVIQAHDFPDPDAVASSFALAYLMQQFEVPTTLVYNGVVDRISLRNMIDWLSIPIVHWKEANLTAADKIVTVDGCIGEKNVMDLPGDEIAVIDHHQTVPPPGLWYQDVRPDYGACATILFEYYRDLGIAMPTAVATALQVGLAIDTTNLTRGFRQEDVTAFAHFNEVADNDLVNRICRNSMQLEELIHYQQLLQNLIIENRVGYAWLPTGCPKSTLGMMGDFLLAIDEIDVVILASPSDDQIQLSLRSEVTAINVGLLVKQMLQELKLGFGGGHAHMAGGLIQRDRLDPADPSSHLFDLFRQRLSTPAWGSTAAAVR